MNKNIIFLIISLISSPSFSAYNGANKNHGQKAGWQLTLGAASIFSPMFEGSGNYGLSILPNIRAAYSDKFFASIPEGVGYNFSSSRAWRYGPLIKLRFSRKEDASYSPFNVTGDTDELKGLGNISAAGEIGGFVSYRTNKLKYKMELRQGFGGHEGFIGNFKINTFGSLGKFRYSFGPEIEYASTDYVDTYFGINAQQEINSGLNQYKASGGITHVGIGGMLLRSINKNVMLTIFANYKRLAGDVAASPIVRQGSSNQFILGVGAGYNF
ncbi:MipA/OmpV family protein [Rickettsiaceae bacterium]|nr:MipA/OmpV family protein [Rickettsiaceae bacterium]